MDYFCILYSNIYKYVFISILNLTFVVLSLAAVKAQEVEHNYNVGPQNVNCDSLLVSGKSEKDACEIIQKGKYRFNQNFRLTRKHSFQGGAFYSCDGIIGYLIIRFDEREMLYLDVRKSLWNELIAHKDPEAFYLEMSDQLQRYRE